MSKTPKRQITREELQRLYVDEKLSSCKIAELLAWPHATVKWWLRKYEIPFRTRAEAAALRRIPEETRRKMSESHKRIGNRPPPPLTRDQLPESHRQSLRRNIERARIAS